MSWWIMVWVFHFALEDCEGDLDLGKKRLAPVDLCNGEAEREVLEELRGLNLAELSPMMAFNRVCQWNSMLKK